MLSNSLKTNFLRKCTEISMDISMWILGLQGLILFWSALQRSVGIGRDCQECLLRILGTSQYFLIPELLICWTWQRLSGTLIVLGTFQCFLIPNLQTCWTWQRLSRMLLSIVLGTSQYFLIVRSVEESRFPLIINCSDILYNFILDKQKGNCFYFSLLPLLSWLNTCMYTCYIIAGFDISARAM